MSDHRDDDVLRTRSTTSTMLFWTTSCRMTRTSHRRRTRSSMTTPTPRASLWPRRSRNVNAVVAEAGGSIWHRLYHGETAFDFIGRTRLWFILSAIAILIGFGGLVVRGFNFGLDFEGGTAWTVLNEPSVNAVRDVIDSEGIPEAKVQQFKPINEDSLCPGHREDRGQRVPTSSGGRSRSGTSFVTDLKTTSTTRRSAHRGEARSPTRRSAPSSSSSSSSSSTCSGGSSGGRPSRRMAAVVHDILITVGIYALSGFEITPSTVVAFLTILGFSLYDTVVVFDRVDENAKIAGVDRPVHLQRRREPEHEPGPDAFAEHLDHRHPSDLLDPRGRRVHPRGHDAAGLRSRDVHRPRDRRVLVDLHRLAGARTAEGARAAGTGRCGNGSRPGAGAAPDRSR